MLAGLSSFCPVTTHRRPLDDSQSGPQEVEVTENPFFVHIASVEDIVLAFWVMNQRSAPLEVSGCRPG
jgi:hypothetical protein